MLLLLFVTDCANRLPCSFFDTVPTGRIINRFASDIDMIDTTLSGIVQRPVELLLKGAMALAVTAAVVPVLVVPLLLLLPIYLQIRELFRRSDRELRRMDSTTKSPIFAHFSEMLAGLQTLRAFDGALDDALAENRRLLALNLTTAFHQRQVRSPQDGYPVLPPPLLLSLHAAVAWLHQCYLVRCWLSMSHLINLGSTSCPAISTYVR